MLSKLPSVIIPTYRPEDLPNADQVIISNSKVVNHSSSISPPLTEVKFLSPAPDVVILALDLSENAIDMVRINYITQMPFCHQVEIVANKRN